MAVEVQVTVVSSEEPIVQVTMAFAAFAIAILIVKLATVSSLPGPTLSNPVPGKVLSVRDPVQFYWMRVHKAVRYDLVISKQVAISKWEIIATVPTVNNFATYAITDAGNYAWEVYTIDDHSERGPPSKEWIFKME